MKMHFTIMLSVLVIAFLLVGCNKNFDDEIENMNQFVTKDLSEYDEVQLDEYKGAITAYCANPLEWFMVIKDEKRYCFVITDKTIILNNKGKKQKHQMFNVGPSDIVEVDVGPQCGSLQEEYDYVDAWFIAKSVKVVDTIEYEMELE